MIYSKDILLKLEEAGFVFCNCATRLENWNETWRKGHLGCRVDHMRKIVEFFLERNITLDFESIEDVVDAIDFHDAKIQEFEN